LDSNHLKKLIEKYNLQTASPEERIQVEDWYAHINGNDPDFNKDEINELKHSIYAAVINSIEHKDAPSINIRQPKKFHISFTWAAIFVTVLLSGIIYLTQVNHGFLKDSAVASKKNKIKPGGNNAILKLADGTELILNQTADGQITNQSGVKVTKTKSGELVYAFIPDSKPDSIQNNSVSTPRGGQYHLVLVDGTEVWLNAGSSITFPTAFIGKVRRVKVSGEVYFEVAKNKFKPFIVNTDQSEIKVLGTHFNVNAYSDEDYQKLTLLEGSIEIKKGNITKILKPGEQASISNASDAIKITEVDNLEAIIAWKNGYFQFSGSDLQSLMRQISRWYDTEVLYNGKIPVKEYVGKIPRDLSVDKLIKMLSYSGIHCKVENQKITINPK
jgi:transmembrane sensor